MEESINSHYTLVDSDHNIYQGSACGALNQFEADGPYENGWTYCPYCGKLIV